MNPHSHLLKDQILKPLIESQPRHTLEIRDKIYLRLVSSIISQQLSTRVAAVIYKRFLDLFDGREPSAEEILQLPPDTLRQIGCSHAKANYIFNVCTFFQEKSLTDDVLYKMSDEEVLKVLTAIKGVGTWTAEMILMFSMGREDIFAFDDLGLKQTLIKLYGLTETDKKLLRQQMVEITDNWKPYRSYASMYLWGFKDG